MKPKTLEQLKELQHQPAQIRNICILAHVDHGKTTIADALVASNGIISKRNAGKIRYMDSRADEQERGITMKSSAITLFYDKQRDSEDASKHYLINLIDSPGHVDFSSEVTTAVRLCDGAVVVVDVVEGVCPQTQAVLRQAWLEEIRPILVLNKVDRLISQLKMVPIEAYYRLMKIIEQVNVIINQLFISEAMEKTSLEATKEGLGDAQTGDSNSYDWTVIGDEEEHKNIYFSPELGNVVFASAVDGWGFTMVDFARVYAAKLGVQAKILQRTLWGDYYINMKAKRIMKGAQSKGKKPLFVQFALDNIWAVYDAVFEQRDNAMIEKIVKSLDLTLAPKDLKNKDSRIILQSIMGQWLPLSDAVLDTVTSHIPSPMQMSEERVEELMCSKSRQFSSLPKTTQQLKKDFLACSSSDDAPVIIFISKMFPIRRKYLPQNKSRPLTEEELQDRRVEARRRHAEIAAQRENATAKDADDGKEAKRADSQQTNGHTYLENSSSNKDEVELDDHVFIAFARIFSGTVRRGSRVFFLGPKHDPGDILCELPSLKAEELHLKPEFLARHPHITSVEIKDLYLLMGRELEALEEIPAGNVFGIGGLEGVVVKSGTLSSTPACPAFADMYFDAAPIVRVAIEPANAGDMNKLVAGLRLLNQADPCVEVRVQETGEHVIIAAGEVHLQKCIDDLKERYAKVEVNVSKPIVPFRETIILPPKTDMVNENIQEQSEEMQEDRGTIQISTSDRQCHLLLRAAPLPGRVAEILLDNQQSLKALDLFAASCTGRTEHQGEYRLTENAAESIKNIRQQLKEEFEKAGAEWVGAEEKIWSFGPRRCGPNILLNCMKDYNRPSVWQSFEKNFSDTSRIADLDNSIVTGFQMATLAGPLCEEPMQGVCFIVEDWWYGDRVKPAARLADVTSSSSISKVNTSDNIESKGSCDNLSEDFRTQTSLSNSVHSDCSNDSSHDRNGSVVYVPGYESFQAHKSAYGPLSGQLISTMKEGCRQAFQTQPQRLMAAMYRCEIQATVEVLGKLHGVLSKRCGQALSEEMQEGTATFVVIAVLPVVESFGFAEDMRKKTSGLASPQLKFSHWEVLPVDPFWVPTTEEEYAHFGEKADAQNKARVYMNQVRKRKGLPTDEKIVEFGEKQRTLTKNK